MAEEQVQAVVTPPGGLEDPATGSGQEIPAAEGVVAADAAPPLPPHHEWYVIHTYSGFENKVKQSIEQRVVALGMSQAVSQVLIPTETVVE
ncbi:MAG: transcription termination/antitermination factor NusG, partial [candidate division NC10 bacterium]|nr:transcription termination/antitermination factor NusG [candidate division NC10 bacterium]